MRTILKIVCIFFVGTLSAQEILQENRSFANIKDSSIIDSNTSKKYFNMSTSINPTYKNSRTQKAIKSFNMGLKTNLLYDILLVPNIGLEFYISKGWTIGGNWMYAWWSNDKRHRFWRIYGGDINVRKYFGRRAIEKPLTGHHIGVYGQILTYDFEIGGRGYMGGRANGTLWNEGNYGAGIEYGYSLPVNRRINLDFSIGIGYLGGSYNEYIPKEGFYLWEKKVHLHWFGPTKAEVSFVWLLGRNNYNVKKGGK